MQREKKTSLGGYDPKFKRGLSAEDFRKRI
jgi:hypothetical protein